MWIPNWQGSCGNEGTWHTTGYMLESLTCGQPVSVPIQNLPLASYTRSLHLHFSTPQVPHLQTGG